MRVLRTGQPKRRHWINTIPGPGRQREEKKGEKSEEVEKKMIERRNGGEGGMKF